jgi:hypothetical protein
VRQRRSERRALLHAYVSYVSETCQQRYAARPPQPHAHVSRVHTRVHAHRRAPTFTCMRMRTHTTRMHTHTYAALLSPALLL